MRSRGAVLVLQIGVIAATLVSLQYKIFELDRYFVPKELVLNAAALILALTLVFSRGNRKWDFADAWLALVDAGKFEESWRAASPYFKKVVSRTDWTKSANSIRSSSRIA